MSNTVPIKDIIKKNIEIGSNKTKMPFIRMLLLGILGGTFIACGAASSSTAMHSIDNVGVARLVGGVIFPVGLMMIVFVGGELFTGDCLMLFGLAQRKYKIRSMLRVLLVVYISNFIGSIIIALLVYLSGQFGYSDSLLGAYTIKVALGKVTISFGSAFFSGIMCNILVCVAVLMSSAAKDVSGKILAIFFPIMAFVIGGYEHCVANMYYIPAGMLAAKNEAYLERAISEYGYTIEDICKINWQNSLVNSVIPVTLGNIFGGCIFVALILYLIHKKDIEK